MFAQAGQLVPTQILHVAAQDGALGGNTNADFPPRRRPVPPSIRNVGYTSFPPLTCRHQREAVPDNNDTLLSAGASLETPAVRPKERRI